MGKELILFQERHVTTRAAAARRLRELADKIEKVEFTLGDHNVVLPEDIELKIQVDPDDEETQVEIELRWEPWDKMPLTQMAEYETVLEEPEEEEEGESEDDNTEE
ncbi:MAG: hypothetical protein OHK0046_43470 [Anaerolineae bacterium]